MLRLSDISSQFNTDSISNCTFTRNILYIQCIGVFMVIYSASFKPLPTVLVFAILIFYYVFSFYNSPLSTLDQLEKELYLYRLHYSQFYL
jgi:hypothetical protein